MRFDRLLRTNFCVLLLLVSRNLIESTRLGISAKGFPVGWMEDPNEKDDDKGKRLRESSSLRKLCARGISSICFKKRKNYFSVFLYLPTELLWKILTFLDPRSLVRFFVVVFFVVFGGR